MEQYWINNKSFVQMELDYSETLHIAIALMHSMQDVSIAFDLFLSKAYQALLDKIEEIIKEFREMDEGIKLNIIFNLDETAHILAALNSYIPIADNLLVERSAKLFIDLFEIVKKAADEAIFK